MPRGDKSKYTDKQQRKAEHIAEGYERKGVSDAEAEKRAWATVNKQDGGGNKPGGSNQLGSTHSKLPALCMHHSATMRWWPSCIKPNSMSHPKMRPAPPKRHFASNSANLRGLAAMPLRRCAILKMQRGSIPRRLPCVNYLQMCTRHLRPSWPTAFNARRCCCQILAKRTDNEATLSWPCGPCVGP